MFASVKGGERSHPFRSKGLGFGARWDFKSIQWVLGLLGVEANMVRPIVLANFLFLVLDICWVSLLRSQHQKVT